MPGTYVPSHRDATASDIRPPRWDGVRWVAICLRARGIAARPWRNATCVADAVWHPLPIGQLKEFIHQYCQREINWTPFLVYGRVIARWPLGPHWGPYSRFEFLCIMRLDGWGPEHGATYCTDFASWCILWLPC